ncbi:MAG TPA: hypothetical protein PL182_01750, partial [Pseudobdellovibrionaceae bacterium]|nr:hypothetical protein [Pseudobdellovibrionaceae bacterium]
INYAGGNVGVGTASPGSPLTVGGTIETTAGGVKFPDGRTQGKAVVLSDHLCPVGQYLRGWDAMGTKICVAVNAGEVNQTYLQVSVGYLVTCAIRSDNLTQCWGYGNYGELGNAANVESRTPVKVRKSDGTYLKSKRLIVGVDTTCAIQASDDRVYCWGYGPQGQIGNGAYLSKNIATPVSNLGAVKELTHTYLAFCAIDVSDRVWCWGANNYYGLGNGTTTASAVPTPTLDQSTGTQLSGMNRLAGATGSAACAYNDAIGSPRIYCWGYNGSGEMGDGTTGGYVQQAKSISMTAMTADGVDQIVSVVGGGDYKNWRNSFCAVGRTAASTYKAYCWGYNAYGNLMIDGDQTAKNVPTVATSVGAKSAPFQLLMSPYTSCMLSGGTVQCAGWGGRGELGNGGTASSYPFVTVLPIGGGAGSFTASSLAVSTGSYDGLSHFCGISTDGYIGCWGYGANGQLGNNGIANSAFPVGVYQE